MGYTTSGFRSASGDPKANEILNSDKVYYVVELRAALLEREVRRRMREGRGASLALYPEGRPSEAPTAGLVLGVLEGRMPWRA